MLPDYGQRLGFAAFRSIRAVGLERAEAIGNRKDTCTERDFCSAETAWVPQAVPALVVAKNQFVDWAGERNVAQDLGSDARMNLDALELLGGERGRFRQDVLRNRQVADVVQQRRRSHGLHVRV